MLKPVLALLFALVASNAIAAGRPNFIVFITDDISQEDIGCYGDEAAQTPNLDQMAAEGLRFTNAYLTCSSCSPSRCSLITGRYPHNTGACELHTELPEGHFLFPKALRDAGYYTALSGKHHMGGNVDHAFEKISKGKGPGKEEDWVTILQQRPQDKPFFFWFASSDAHRGWTINDDAPKLDPSEITVPPYLIDSDTTRNDLADYHHEVSRSDTFAGKLRSELESQGIAGDTYLIYLSDNGRPFPRCKTRLYDSGVKSPLIVFCPGRVEPAVCESLVSVNIDLGPTILELAAVEQSPRMQGVSLTPLLDDPSSTVRDFAFSEHNWHVMQANERMVRHGKYLFIQNNYPERQSMCVESAPAFPAGRDLWDAHAAGTLTEYQKDIFLIPRPEQELYDVVADPHQLNNLAGDESYQSQVGQLSVLLKDWTEQTKDSISTNPTPDRQNAQGKKYPRWRHRIQPGVEVGSIETNASGPIRTR